MGRLNVWVKAKNVITFYSHLEVALKRDEIFTMGRVLSAHELDVKTETVTCNNMHVFFGTKVND